MDDWRERWSVAVASDARAGSGIGWAFSAVTSGVDCWTVFREDGGPFPVFTSARGIGPLPDQTNLLAMTRTAVNDLLAAAGFADPVGWITDDIAAALMFASDDISSWDGIEWALESGPDDEPMLWSDHEAERTPYDWLQANCAAAARFVITYQDDADFGLRFSSSDEPRPLPADDRSVRSRCSIPLTVGRIDRVDVVYDTSDGKWRQGSGVLTEALLYGQHGSTLLIAAEAYSASEWHLRDESVVALRHPTQADLLDWLPPRQPWPFSRRTR